MAYQPASFITDISNPYDSLPSSLEEHSDNFSTQARTLRLETWDVANEDPISGLFANESPNFHSPSMFGIDGGDSNADFSVTFEQMQHGCIDNFPIDQHNNILQCNTRLSNLNLDLSKRLQQCLGSMSGDLPRSHDPRSKFEGNGLWDCDGTNTIFERALGDLSEFIAVIRSYTSKKNDLVQGVSTGEPIRQGAASGPAIGPTRPISLVVLLNLFSAYFQIVTIYDKIIGALHIRLCGVGPLGSSCGGFGQRTPDVRLLGFSASQGALQTKILIHAILHQFDVIERTLGLRADLRVTDTQGVHLGLFEDERARSLLGAVSNTKRIENGWVQDHTGTEDDSSAKALSTLRVALKAVHDFLDA